jgi:hypothetical protein
MCALLFVGKKEDRQMLSVRNSPRSAVRFPLLASLSLLWVLSAMVAVEAQTTISNRRKAVLGGVEVAAILNLPLPVLTAPSSLWPNGAD